MVSRLGRHVEIKPGVYWVGVDDRETKLFESLWSLPHGVSYNSYLILGERKVLVDTVKAEYAEELIENINSVIDVKELDYVIVNHLEPDHSGSLPEIVKNAPNVKIVGTNRAIDMVKSFFHLDQETISVRDGSSLDIGGKTLRFIEAMWLHWPETMFTYLVEDKILFPCDAFGSFGALGNKIFDDEVDLELFFSESKRYFATIVSKYSKFVLRAIEKIKNLGIDIEIIAPGHGPVYRKNPLKIVELFEKWSRGTPGKRVAIVYGSMHGNTKKIAEVLEENINSESIDTVVHDISYGDISFILRDLLNAPAVIFGCPTYDGNIFPPLRHLVNLLEIKRLQRKIIGLFGTYAWGGNALSQLKKILVEMGHEVIEPIVSVKGAPTIDDLEKIKSLAKKIASRVLNKVS